MFVRFKVLQYRPGRTMVFFRCFPALRACGHGANGTRTVTVCMHAANLEVAPKEKESLEDLKMMAHPWACITQMLLVDSASDNMTTCICCTNSCLLMMCKIGLRIDDESDNPSSPSA